jgi:hypothetical protein
MRRCRERQGWRFHRIWSTEWFHDKNACAEKKIAACHDAVHHADDSEPASRDIQRPESATPVRAADEGELPADLVHRRQPEKSVSRSARERLQLRLTVAEMYYAIRRMVELQAPWISDRRPR